MPRRIRAVQIAFNSLLPEDLRDYNRKLDAGDINDLMAKIAKRNPENYAVTLQNIGDMGRRAAYFSGETVTLNDMKPTFDLNPVYAAMDAEIAGLRKSIKNDEEFEKARESVWHTYNKLIENRAMETGLANRNNLALAVASGARGKRDHLKAMTATPGLFSDGSGRTVPMFVRNSYGQGLRPAHWLATTYGARKAIISTKVATAKGGAFSKLLNQAVTPLVVTTRDCGVKNGLDLSIDDDSLEGRLLARETAGYPAGTVIDRDMVNTLKKQKKGDVIARSVITCQAKTGICAKCAGLQAEGHLPKVGDMLGVTAGQAIGEPITQSALNVKHCLAEGTLVLMASGEERRIEDVLAGEYVLGADRSGRTFPVLVKAVWDQGMQEVFLFAFENGATITATDCHKSLSVLSQPIGIPDKYPLGSEDGSVYKAFTADAEFVIRTDVVALPDVRCWDLSVDHPDQLFVLANRLIVSNTGGMSSAQKDYAGFAWINQFVQTPEVFQDEAPVSKVAGVVQAVEEAPQGGYYVKQGNQEYYIQPGFKVLVKPGDNLEAGEQLSEGLVDPHAVVAARGLGEGRKYYVDRLSKMLADSGMKADRRNVETVARATLDHVRVLDIDKIAGALPDDVLSYNALSARYEPEDDSELTDLDKADGRYLQEPQLHYTIGTKMTPKMLAHLRSRGINEVLTSERKPAFEPEMIRLQAAAHNQPDWLAAQHTSYLTKGLQERAIRGQDTNIKENVHFAPRLAYGEGFGKNLETTGKF